MAGDQGWLLCGDALIRSVLHMDPAPLSDAQWACQIRLAEWAEQRRLRKLAQLLGG